MMLRILTLLPDLLNVNGDAENARVLAQRARWAGIECEVVAESSTVPDIVVIGSGFDGEAEVVAAGLRRVESQLQLAVRAHVPVLAIGLGFELLGERITLADERDLSGLGLIPGVATPAREHAVGDLVVDSTFGILIGYENHARSYSMPPATPALGSVLHGVGNGDGSAREGILLGSVIGSYLHGPVLAHNPVVADDILIRATAGRYSADNSVARWADSLAATTRSKVMKRLTMVVVAVLSCPLLYEAQKADLWLI
jgi:CobQ-like glutamine amidotransferase family enzyme